MAETDTNYYLAVYENFPALSIHSWKPLREGWANKTFLANQTFVFRFPKHSTAARNLLREVGFLAELAPTLPLAIPRYDYIGQPTAHFPFPFGGYAYIPGVPLSQCLEQEHDASWWQQPLGVFLSALHRFPTQRAQQLLKEDGYITPQAWQQAIIEMCIQVRAHIFPLLTQHQQQATGRYFDSVLNDATLFSFTPVVLHQDFYPHNILVDVANKAVTGVLDWSNCTIGDPAQDVGDLLPYYTGIVDAGWQGRAAFYKRTSPFPDLLHVLEHGPQDKLTAIRKKIDAMWQP